MAVENNMDDELDQVSAEAMQIIMSAGDARVRNSGITFVNT